MTGLQTQVRQEEGGVGGGKLHQNIFQSFKEIQLKFRGARLRQTGRRFGLLENVCCFGGSFFCFVLFYFGGRFCEWFCLPACQHHIFTLLPLKGKKGRQRHKQAQWGLGPTQRNDLGGFAARRAHNGTALWHTNIPPKNLYSNISLQIQVYINL